MSTGWSWTGPNGFTSTVRNPNINAITPSQSGKYTANYTNANGCSNSLDLILEIKSIESVTYNYQINGGTWKTGTNSTMCEGDDIQFAAWPVSGSSWSWSGPSGFTSSLRNPLLSNISTNQFGVYSTTQTDGNSCKSSASFTINKCMVTALEGTIENKIVVFPNPNTGNFTLAMEDEFEHHVMIIDLRGNEMYHATFVGSLNINSDLPSGFYLLRIDENFLTQKLIVD